MPQQTRLSKNNTAILHNDGMTEIILHSTKIVSFNAEKIVLNTGGYFTATTKTRMNQASYTFNLGYQVYQVDYSWHVDYNGKTFTFEGNSLTIERE